MNKEQFIAYMNKRLAIIKEEERKDIIDEYCNHIDEKVTEGLSEEEVIAGFGNIDEMINEILDAYNIDYHHTKSSDGFDRKVNEFLDTVFDSFQKLLSQVTSMDVDSVIRLLFEMLVVLILLSLLYIPFQIIASVGSGILRGLFWYGIGSTFAWMWNFVIKLIYIAMFIAVLINVTTRRWSHWKGRKDTPIMDDVKESFNFEQAKQAVHRFTSGTATNKNNTDWESPYQEEQEDAETQETKGAYEERRYGSYREQSSSTTFSVFYSVMKFFGFLLMLPFILLIIGLCCVLGVMVIMSIQGISMLGFYFIIIGSLIGCGAIVGLIDRFFCKGGRNR